MKDAFKRKNWLRCGSIFVVLLLALGPVSAQERNPRLSLLLDFPLTDLTYQLKAAEASGNFLTSFVHPSMPQSLAMSNNLITSVHFGIGKLVKIDEGFIDFLLENALSTGFFFLQSGLPFGLVWLHEEYHKAVLARRSFDSFNEVYYFRFFSSVVRVSHVSDEALKTLANQYSPEFVRLNSSGAESQVHQIQTLQSYSFFYDQKLPNLPYYWLSLFNNFNYIFSCADPSAFDKDIDKWNDEEKEIKQRDFTGPDFTAWVRELFAPELPYEARGTHPSGVGINRYIKASQLTEHEKFYLVSTSFKHLINFVSPFMVGINHLTVDGTHQFNFAFRHLLTSFGDDLSLDIYYRNRGLNLLISPHFYSNYTTLFFGLEASVLDYPIVSRTLWLNGRLMLWTQPYNQSFTTNEHSFGGLLGVKIAYRQGIWEPYLTLEAKTKGWVMGNIFLDEDISGRLGLVIRIP